MKKILLFLSAILSFGASGAHLSPQEALDNYLESSRQRLKGINSPAYTHCFTASNEQFYAFNKTGGGFVILSANSDIQNGILGYADNGCIDTTALPIGLQWWFNMMSVCNPRQAFDLDPHEEILPLVSTKWNQNAPYNDNCPSLRGQKTYTGCMATAMAQVLAHESNRMQPSGGYSYFWQSGGKDLSFNYKKHPFEYDLMTDEYNEGSSEASRAAVANLMYAVGIACDMDFGTEASSTTNDKSGMGLIRNLGCDQALAIEERNFYTMKEWDDLIYGQLSNGHPVLYTGVGRLGGHAFVCDGYQRQEDTNYYHINWGWGGMSDGYFLLGLLNPPIQGIGGDVTAEGFNASQAAYIGLKPAAQDSEPTIIFRQYGSLKSKAKSYDRDNMVTFLFNGNINYNGGALVNGSLVSVEATAGIKMTDTETSEVSYSQISDLNRIVPLGGFSAFNFPGSALPEKDGVYSLELVVKIGDEWVDVQHERAYLNKLLLTVEGDSFTFDFIDEGERLQTTFTEYSEEFNANACLPLTVEFKAAAEAVDVEVFPGLAYLNGWGAAQMSTKKISLQKGESTTIEWNEVFDPMPEKGSYYLVIIDRYGNLYSDLVPVKVLAPSGIDEVSEDEDSGVHYYTVDGLPITGTPTPGKIIIENKGGKSKKIIISK